MPLEQFGQDKVEKPVYTQERKKNRFLDLNTTATIRILSDARVVVDTHFLNRSTVQCLGDECPICQSNKSLIMQNPEGFRDEPHYSPKRQVKMVNVLDFTPVRTCGNCGEENTGMTCKGCNQIVTSNPVPSDKVKILSRGVQLFDTLDLIAKSVRNADGEVVGITNYDITLAVSGSGKNKTIAPIAGQQLPIRPVAEDELFDLETVVPKLTPNEMVDLQRGVSFRDIFAARKASKKMVDADNFISKEVLDSATDDVDALFGVKK